MSQDIHMITLHNLLKNNLGAAELLILLHADNLCGWELQYDTVLMGEQDREQWKVSTTALGTMSWLILYLKWLVNFQYWCPHFYQLFIFKV